MSGMPKPWRMRCQSSGGGLVRSTSAIGGRGLTVALVPSNGFSGADTTALGAGAAAGAPASVAATGGPGSGCGDCCDDGVAQPYVTASAASTRRVSILKSGSSNRGWQRTLLLDPRRGRPGIYSLT